jgi:hypothetical protein
MLDGSDVREAQIQEFGLRGSGTLAWDIEATTLVGTWFQVVCVFSLECKNQRRSLKTWSSYLPLSGAG